MDPTIDTIRDHLQWRSRRVRNSIGAAFQTRQVAAYLYRDARRSPTHGEYTIQGRRIHLVHGTEDTSIFQEVFKERFYELTPLTTSALGEPHKIADLGGNIGVFGLWAAIHWPHAQLIAFEPDPTNARKYRQFLKDNNLDWQLVEACAMPMDGSVSFEAGHESTSQISLTGTGISVPGVDVFPTLTDVDLLKMDIEGGEWGLMCDARFRELQARVILLEYHPQMCPAPDAKHLATRLLAEAGYRTETIFHDAATGVGMIRAYK
jgi:FkbM family methyltransferase